MTVELLAIFSCKSFQQELSNKVLYHFVIRHHDPR